MAAGIPINIPISNGLSELTPGGGLLKNTANIPPEMTPIIMPMIDPWITPLERPIAAATYPGMTHANRYNQYEIGLVMLPPK